MPTLAKWSLRGREKKNELLEQVDNLIGRNSGVKGERGTQNSKRYCIITEIDPAGKPKKIIKAWHESVKH